MTGKHLVSHERDLSLVTRHIEQYQVMAVATHGHSPGMIKVLHQTYHGEVAMVATLGEQLCNALVFGNVSHQVIKYDQIWLGSV